MAITTSTCKPWYISFHDDFENIKKELVIIEEEFLKADETNRPTVISRMKILADQALLINNPEFLERVCDQFHFELRGPVNNFAEEFRKVIKNLTENGTINIQNLNHKISTIQKACVCAGLVFKHKKILEAFAKKQVEIQSSVSTSSTSSSSAASSSSASSSLTSSTSSRTSVASSPSLSSSSSSSSSSHSIDITSSCPNIFTVLSTPKCIVVKEKDRTMEFPINTFHFPFYNFVLFLLTQFPGIYQKVNLPKMDKIPEDLCLPIDLEDFPYFKKLKEKLNKLVILKDLPKDTLVLLSPLQAILDHACSAQTFYPAILFKCGEDLNKKLGEKATQYVIKTGSKSSASPAPSNSTSTASSSSSSSASSLISSLGIPARMITKCQDKFQILSATPDSITIKEELGIIEFPIHIFRLYTFIVYLYNFSLDQLEDIARNSSIDPNDNDVISLPLPIEASSIPLYKELYSELKKIREQEDLFPSTVTPPFELDSQIETTINHGTVLIRVLSVRAYKLREELESLRVSYLSITTNKGKEVRSTSSPSTSLPSNHSKFLGELTNFTKNLTDFVVTLAANKNKEASSSTENVDETILFDEKLHNLCQEALDSVNTLNSFSDVFEKSPNFSNYLTVIKTFLELGKESRQLSLDELDELTGTLELINGEGKTLVTGMVNTMVNK